jgi:hypothetical protein
MLPNALDPDGIFVFRHLSSTPLDNVLSALPKDTESPDALWVSNPLPLGHELTTKPRTHTL